MTYKIRVLTKYLPELPRGITNLEEYYEKESKVYPVLTTNYDLRDGLEIGKVYYDPEYCHIYRILDKVNHEEVHQ